MSEQIPSIQEQIDKEYQPFSIIANLILSYCRTGNINNPTGYQGDYLDTISDCTDLLDTAMESEKGTDRMLVSNALLGIILMDVRAKLQWNAETAPNNIPQCLQ